MASVCSFSLPSLASSSAFSLPSMLACACTLYNIIGLFLCCSISTISRNMVLFGWLLCSVRCFICVLIMYNPLRQSVNMCASSLGYYPLIILKVACIAINYALKMFCKHGSLTTSSKFWIDYIHHILFFLLSSYHQFVVVEKKNHLYKSNIEAET